jgi:hypothetical protein
MRVNNLRMLCVFVLFRLVTSISEALFMRSYQLTSIIIPS